MRSTYATAGHTHRHTHTDEHTERYTQHRQQEVKGSDEGSTRSFDLSKRMLAATMVEDIRYLDPNVQILSTISGRGNGMELDGNGNSISLFHPL